VSGQLDAPAALTPSPGTDWIRGCVGPRTGLDSVDRREILTLPGLELRPLGLPTRSQSLNRLSYRGSRGSEGTHFLQSGPSQPTFRGRCRRAGTCTWTPWRRDAAAGDLLLLCTPLARLSGRRSHEEGLAIAQALCVVEARTQHVYIVRVLYEIRHLSSVSSLIFDRTLSA
jgi:hypothetical protein